MLLQVNKGVALSLHFLYARNVCGMLATRFASARRHFIPLVCRLCFIKRTMSNGTHLERTTDKPRGRVSRCKTKRPKKTIFKLLL